MGWYGSYLGIGVQRFCCKARMADDPWEHNKKIILPWSIKAVQAKLLWHVLSFLDVLSLTFLWFCCIFFGSWARTHNCLLQHLELIHLKQQKVCRNIAIVLKIENLLIRSSYEISNGSKNYSHANNNLNCLGWYAKKIFWDFFLNFVLIFLFFRFNLKIQKLFKASRDNVFSRTWHILLCPSGWRSWTFPKGINTSSILDILQVAFTVFTRKIILKRSPCPFQLLKKLY